MSAIPGKAMATLRSTPVRVGFLALVVVLAVYAVVSQWDEILPVVVGMNPLLLLGALAAGVVYVLLTMLAWRVLLADMGTTVPLGIAFRVFFVSQLGKYLPGGVWNIVAAAELGADHDIPRRRSVSVMAVTVVVSIVTGTALAVAIMPFASERLRESYGWVSWTLPAFVIVLLPPVLNRLLARVFRLAGRPPLEHPVSWAGIGACTAWTLVAWMVAGIQVWLLAVGLGMTGSLTTLALCVGGYAMAWTVGFLIVFVPAGAGVREGVLALVLAGSLTTGGVVAVVLLSRAVLTIADLAMGSAGIIAARRERRAVTPRWLGAWRHWRTDLGIALTIGLVTIAVAAVQLMRVTEISPVDEATHIDYVWRIMHGELPHRGDTYTSFTLGEWACRKQANVLDKLPACGVDDLSQFQVIRENYNAWQPPGFFAAVALLTRIGVALTALDAVTLMRLSCAVLVAVGMGMVYALLRLWGVARELAAPATLMLLANPFTLMVATTVSTDAPFLILGVLAALVLTLELNGRSAAPLALVTGACTGLVKTISLSALIIVLALLGVIAVIRLVRGQAGWWRPLLTVGAGVVGGGAVTFAWGRYVTANTPPDWVNLVLGQNNTDYVGLPFDEWLPTLTHVFGYTAGAWQGAPVSTYQGNLLIDVVGLALTVIPFCGLVVLRGSERVVAGVAAIGPVMVVLFVQAQSWMREEVYFPSVSARYGITLIPLTMLVLGLLLRPVRVPGRVVTWCVCAVVLLGVFTDVAGLCRIP
ncbi:lysylphosphatidylglycerol synthase domain-containing protein [Actinomyces qiguomingii]|uniref:lysylphosphatidylglycerol synthase domain-containing protein n=1 Tax=Actinomyces qiguomingii TaxID=2057800 RepID=UPI000CA069C9|nr:lysylphosphatidylglycerol synthase domain-containing protein [Actinomyces qiguomingii]